MPIMQQPKPTAPIASRAKTPMKLGMPRGNAALHASRLARALASQEDKQQSQKPQSY